MSLCCPSVLQATVTLKGLPSCARDTPELRWYEDGNNVTRALMGYRNITRLTDRAASFDKEATMRSGNYPKYIHGIADGLSRLARMPAYWWRPAPEWFRSDDPEAAGDGVERAKISNVLYVTSPEGGLEDVLMYVYVNPSGERFGPHLLACLDTHHCRVSVKFSNDRLVSYPVR